MMRQNVRAKEPTPGCEHGKPLTVRCAACVRLAEALDREFWRGVFFGDWDADGYTRGERRSA